MNTRYQNQNRNESQYGSQYEGRDESRRRGSLRDESRHEEMRADHDEDYYGDRNNSSRYNRNMDSRSMDASGRSSSEWSRGEMTGDTYQPSRNSNYSSADRDYSSGRSQDRLSERGQRAQGEDRFQRYGSYQGYGTQNYGPHNYGSQGFGADHTPSYNPSQRYNSGSSNYSDSQGFGRSQGSSYERYGDQGFSGGESLQGRHAGRGPKGYRRSDDRIKEEVCDALTHDSRVDASEIEVSVESGVVTLKGTVEERQMKRMAEECAENIHGVSDVKNEIRVQAHTESSRSSSSDLRSGSSADGSFSSKNSSSAASKNGKSSGSDSATRQ